MSTAPTPFDASSSALGYLYQCRYALLLALEHEEDPSLQMSIEKLDDVTFCKKEADGSAASEILQFKHHIKRQGGVSDKSVDIWKSIRIWSELVSAKAVTLGSGTFVLVTTSRSTSRHAAHLLLPQAGVRNPAEALRLLETAGKEATNETVKTAYSSLMKLTAAQRRKMFEAIYLLEDSADVVDVRSLLEKAVRHAIRPQHRKAFVDRLEGWWFSIVIEHLMSSQNSTIAVGRIQQHVHDLCEQFRRESLPDDLLRAEIPTDAVPDDDNRMFIQQLRLIQILTGRIKTAQEDHYRAFAQRSRWVRDNLLELDELDHFESRLIDEWRHKFEIMLEGVTGGVDDHRHAMAGRGVYNWTQENAPTSSALFIRPQFQSSYMVRGSYHMLADLLRVGWHPRFREQLGGEPKKGGNHVEGVD